MINKVLTGVSSVVVLVLCFMLYKTVDNELLLKQQIIINEKLVEKKLRNIRTAEKLYYGSRGAYTDNWDSLRNFIRTGKIYNVSITEINEDLGYGRQKTTRIYDTLGSVIVYDSVFSKIKDFDLDNMEKLPQDPSKSFKIAVDKKITKSGTPISLIFVADSNPVNPVRNEDNIARINQPLHFGSLDRVTTDGNWE